MQRPSQAVKHVIGRPNAALPSACPRGRSRTCGMTTFGKDINARRTTPMAIHLTPTELGREAGMHRREVIAKCMELGVPIFQGRIDKTLFMSSMKELQGKAQLAKAS